MWHKMLPGLIVGLILGSLIFSMAKANDKDVEMESMRKKIVAEITAQIRSNSSDTVLGGVGELRDLLGNMEESLIEVAQDNSNNIFSRLAAIHIVGCGMKTKNKNSIKTISDLINNDGPSAVIGDTRHINAGTPGDALVRIGRPAIPQLIKNITESDDKNVIETSIWVIHVHFAIRRHTYEFLEKLNKKYKDNPEILKRLEIAKKKIDSFKYPGGYKEPLY